MVKIRPLATGLQDMEIIQEVVRTYEGKVLRDLAKIEG
jgi:hypothetical protein